MPACVDLPHNDAVNVSPPMTDRDEASRPPLLVPPPKSNQAQEMNGSRASPLACYAGVGSSGTRDLKP